MESECDTCCESEHMYNTSVGEIFPAIITRTFDEAFAAEDSFFQHLLSFRMFRYARTALGLGKLPWDMLFVLARNVKKWLSYVVAPEWLKTKINAIVDFVLMELERQKSRYSQFSCLLPVPEISYLSNNYVRKEPDIELSEDARKELAFIRESDKRKKAKLDTRAAVTTSKDWAAFDDAEDEDSFQHVIQYSKNHDSMYQFHYLDENNRLRKFELFNMAEPNKRYECHASHKLSDLNIVEAVLEEEAELTEEYGESSNKAEEVDSGLSGVEVQTDTSHRDACCSPVQYFPAPLRMSSRSKGSSRRHTAAGGTTNQPSSR
ncbi:unnamed protein product [Strongylus vulgaris]|uniref:Uncharacterized protein n=1 Tax=Strongylus vulgaris TaxID=40348 RepID=A0A3P7IFF2_STRVU|nr:unnamed protein product [Strongylus vulgaris]